jgi:hypothetical protein
MSSGSSLTSKLYDKIIKMLSKSHETIPLIFHVTLIASGKDFVVFRDLYWQNIDTVPVPVPAPVTILKFNIHNWL